MSVMKTYSSESADEILAASDTEEFHRLLFQLHETSIELSRTKSLDELYKVAVDNAIHRLGIDRLGILMIDYANDLMLGTWGTDEKGNVRSEADFAAPMQQEVKDVIAELSTRGKVCVWFDKELYEFSEEDGGNHVIGQGWNGAIAIWEDDTVIGWIACDNFLNKKPFMSYQSHILRLFGSLLAEFILRKRSEMQVEKLNASLERSVAERTFELYETQRKLEETNALLEQKVIARTASLNSKNNELQRIISQLESTQTELVKAKTQASLKDLVVGIAHEMNTPIGVAVTANSSLPGVLDRVKNDINNGTLTKEKLLNNIEYAIETAKLISNSLNSAASLVTEFKRLSTFEAEDFPIRKTKIEDWLNNVVAISKLADANVEKLAITFQIETEQPVLATRIDVLSQVLRDLILNTAQHGTLAQASPQLLIHVQQSATELIIALEDNGPGIDEALQPKIFNPFVTTDRKSGRKGLGLNVAVNLVSYVMHGTLSYYPATLGGAGFKMQCPL